MNVSINLEKLERQIQHLRDNKGCRGLSHLISVLFYCKGQQLNNADISTEEYVQMMVEQKCCQDKPSEIKHWVNLINKAIKKTGKWGE